MSSALSASGLRDRDRLFAGALHVERGLALALGAVHAVVEGAHQHHVLEAAPQRVDVEARVPRAEGLVVVVEHADQRVGDVLRFFRGDVQIGTADFAGQSAS